MSNRTKLLRLVIIALVGYSFLCAEIGFAGGDAKRAHVVPYNSLENAIELEIQREGISKEASYLITPVLIPEGFEIEPRYLSLKLSTKQNRATTRWHFSVDTKVVLDSIHSIKFEIIDGSGNKWSKTIDLVIGQPEKFELFQNYPNPFNSETTIRYSLPGMSQVSIEVFNILGQEVFFVPSDIRGPGFHQERIDFNRLPTGVYFYSLTAVEENGRRFTARKRVVLIK